MQFHQNSNEILSIEINKITLGTEVGSSLIECLPGIPGFGPQNNNKNNNNYKIFMQRQRNCKNIET